MQKDRFNHGFAESDWQKAKEEARQAMIARVREGGLISYSELVSQLQTINLEAHDTRLDHMLGEIAAEEDEAGRGMLTAIVVHKHGEQRPGRGFFEMAKKLGRVFHDQEAFWIEEWARVREVWEADAK